MRKERKLNESGSLNDFWRKRGIKSSKELINKAQSFFRNQVDKLKSASLKKFAWKKVNRPTIGRMYFYAYDPKHKKTLPLYDRLPLVIPIEHYKDGFLGVNLHYLPPTIRYRFLQQLIKIGGARNLTETTRLELSYKMLSRVATSSMFQPTIHRYLYPHIKSSITLIKPQNWKYVVFLPSAKWAKGKPY